MLLISSVRLELMGGAPVVGAADVKSPDSYSCTSNKKNRRPYKAGPSPLHKPLMPVSIPNTTPMAINTHGDY